MPCSLFLTVTLTRHVLNKKRHGMQHMVSLGMHFVLEHRMSYGRASADTRRGIQRIAESSKFSCEQSWTSNCFVGTHSPSAALSQCLSARFSACGKLLPPSSSGRFKHGQSSSSLCFAGLAHVARFYWQHRQQAFACVLSHTFTRCKVAVLEIEIWFAVSWISKHIRSIRGPSMSHPIQPCLHAPSLCQDLVIRKWGS